MPFQNHGNRAFSVTSVDKNAPAASGVYGLADARGWIYVGETANIHDELLGLLRNPDGFFRDHWPSGFTFEVSAPAQRRDRCNRLVQELSPIGNR